MTAAAGAGRPYLLDTGVILHLVRGKALGQRIQQTFDLIHCQPRPLVSVVSLAEARVLAQAGNWGAAKRQALDKAFRSLTIVNINHPSVIDAYVQLISMPAPIPKALETWGRTTCGLRQRPLPPRPSC